MPFFNHITLPLPHAHPTSLCLTFEILLNMLHNRMSVLGNVHEIHKIAQKAAQMRDHIKVVDHSTNKKDNSSTSFWSVYSTYYMSTLKFVMHFELENNDWKGEFCDRLRRQNSGSSGAPVGVIGKVRLQDSAQCKWFAVVPQFDDSSEEGWQFFCCDNEVLEMRWESSDADLKNILAKHNWFPFQLEVYGLELKVVNHDLSRLVSDDDSSFQVGFASVPSSPVNSARPSSALSSPASQHSMNSSSSRFQQQQTAMTPPTRLNGTHFGGSGSRESASVQRSSPSHTPSSSTRQSAGVPVFSQQETSWIKPSPSLQPVNMERRDSSSSFQYSQRNVPQITTISNDDGRIPPQQSVYQSFNRIHQQAPDSPQLQRRSHTLRNDHTSSRNPSASTSTSPSKASLHAEIDRLRKTIASLESDKRHMQKTIEEQDRMLQQICQITQGYNQR